MTNQPDDRNQESSISKQLLVMRDIEGAQALETHIMAGWRIRPIDDQEINSPTLNSFSKKIFGITYSNTQLDLTPDQMKILETSEKKEEWEEMKESFESQLTTTDASPEEAVEILLSLGVDFRSVDGYPLNMTRYLARQAEAAARGFMGKLPDLEKLEIERWATNLLIDKKRH